MVFQGVLQKMETELKDEVQYFLNLSDRVIHLNEWLDRDLELIFVGHQCLNCGQEKRIFRQGFCYNCFYESPLTADWIIKPEMSTAHLGIEDRDLEYEKEVQLKPHVVYLANSSHVKVGVTRKTQIPTRWIDQGAGEALPILETPNRYLAGIGEVALKSHISDKTNWRKMLINEPESANLFNLRSDLVEYLPGEVRDYVLDDAEVTEIHYPVITYPKKVKSLNLEKQKRYNGRLMGIKGQYLIFRDDTVFNIRGNSGLVIDLVT